MVLLPDRNELEARLQDEATKRGEPCCLEDLLTEDELACFLESEDDVLASGRFPTWADLRRRLKEDAGSGSERKSAL